MRRALTLEGMAPWSLDPACKDARVPDDPRSPGADRALGGRETGSAFAPPAESAPVSLRKLPKLVRQALGIVWTAARRELVLSWALTTLGAAAVVGQLLLVRSFLDAVVSPQDPAQGLGDVAFQVVALAVLTAVSGFAMACAVERQRMLAELTARHVHSQLLEVAARVNLATFETSAFHDHLQRATVNAASRPYQLAVGLTGLASGLVGTVAITATLASMQPLAAALVLLGAGPQWIATSRNSRALYRLSYQLTPADRERGYLSHLLVGKDEARELRAYDLGQFLRSRFSVLYDDRIVRMRQLVALRQRRSLTASAISAGLFVAAIAGLLQLTFTGHMSLAAAGAAAVGVHQLAGRLRAAMVGVSTLYECSLFLDDVASFMSMPGPPASAAGDTPSGSAPESVALDRVSFTYPGTDRPVLEDVSMTLRRGEVTALVGPNGAGKSTIVKLLCGLYQPTGGSMLWDGGDTSPDAETIRQHVSVIFQDFLRYQLSGTANIGLGRTERIGDTGAVRAAARLSGADAFLASLPHGYDTLLSRAFFGGTELSLGQWQRVALARMLFRDAPVVILDEPASALDVEAERDLFERVRALARDKAVLLISHRFSTVRSATRIHLLERGRVVESGDHDSLMRSGGRYSTLFGIQAAAYMDGGTRLSPR